MSGRRGAAGAGDAAPGAAGASTAGRGAAACGRGAGCGACLSAAGVAELPVGSLPTGAVAGAADAALVAPGEVGARPGGADSGAPNPEEPALGTNAGVGGRSVEGGNDGAPNAVLAGGVRRGGATGGMRPAGGVTGVAVLTAAGGCDATPARGGGGCTDGAGARGGAACTGAWTAGRFTGAPAVAFWPGTPGGLAEGCGAAGLWTVRGAAGSAPRSDAGLDASASGKSSPQLTLADTGITPPHTEQRARTAAPTTFAGSTRNTDRHSGQDTFITHPRC